MFEDVVVKERFINMMKTIDAISEFMKEAKAELQEVKQELKELRLAVSKKGSKEEK